MLHTTHIYMAHLNGTILPTLYGLLNLEFYLPRSLTWFESRFKFFNHDFVCGIRICIIKRLDADF